MSSLCCRTPFGADRFGTTLPRLDDLPDEVRELTERITWAVALTELLPETDSDFSPEGPRIATTWVKSFDDLAQRMRSNPKAKAFPQDLSRTRFTSDMPADNDLGPEQFRTFLAQDAETTLAAAQAPGRIQKVIRLRDDQRPPEASRAI